MHSGMLARSPCCASRRASLSVLKVTSVPTLSPAAWVRNRPPAVPNSTETRARVADAGESRMKAIILTLTAAFALMLQQSKPLDVYYVDTEGGKSVLFVSPTGETLLFDTGTGGDGNRDLDRILAVIKAANLPIQQLDHVIVSHYHGDHSGNAAVLAYQLLIRHFYHHDGWTVELQSNRSAAFNAYRPIRDKAHVIVPKTC